VYSRANQIRGKQLPFEIKHSVLAFVNNPPKTVIDRRVNVSVTRGGTENKRRANTILNNDSTLHASSVFEDGSATPLHIEEYQVTEFKKTYNNFLNGGNYPGAIDHFANTAAAMSRAKRESLGVYLPHNKSSSQLKSKGSVENLGEKTLVHKRVVKMENK
jgi:hypothetical protein